MQLETVLILEHRDYGAGYRLLKVAAPGIAPQVQPGQFVHVRVPRLNDAVLRRPFSAWQWPRNQPVPSR